MYMTVTRSGKKVDYKSDVGEEITKRMDPLGERPNHGDFYKSIGFEYNNEHHPTDWYFRTGYNGCNGWNKFLDEYIDPTNVDAEECRARTKKLLKAIEKFISGIEKASISYTVTVEI